jgi:hypothetical protein
MRPGFPRIAAEENARRRRARGRLGHEINAESCSDAFERSVVERIFTGDSANAVRAEKLFAHEIEM